MKKCALVVTFAALLSSGLPANARGTGLWGGKTAGGVLSQPGNGGKTGEIIDLINLFISEFRSFATILTTK